ncbi:hypothetical protein EB105725_11_01780 [Shimwellia blattae DSM 4481 = NBRC 105725]|nr:hypothetical protein EB105725_11_01780 [Shimwellia blattae DSM 4481 = NBRC 105725]
MGLLTVDHTVYGGAAGRLIHREPEGEVTGAGLTSGVNRGKQIPVKKIYPRPLDASPGDPIF